MATLCDILFKGVPMHHSTNGAVLARSCAAAAAIAALLSLAGCLNTDAALQRETARLVGGIAPDAVQLSDVKRGMTTVDWKAATPKGAYTCTSDDTLRNPLCTPAN